MEQQKRPRVATIGGFYNFGADEAARELAQQYAEDLGRALAERGFGLVVYFSNPQSLEPHVVRGFVAALPSSENDQCIDLRYSEAQRGDVRFAEQDSRPELFHEDPFPGQNWEAPFYRSLAAAKTVDAVVLMAGGKSTLNAGQVAVGRGLPLLAIDKFEGAAQTLRSELAARTDGYPSTQSLSTSDLIGWLREQQDRESKRRERERARDQEYERFVSQRRARVWFAGALLALVVGLFFGVSFVDTARPLLWATGGALIAAGAAGALARGLTTAPIRLEPSIACLLGMAAGLAVGIAYLIPQLIGAPGLLNSGEVAVRATDRIQFLSAVLVAIPAGVGFDTIFRRMLEESKRVPLSLGK